MGQPLEWHRLMDVTLMLSIRGMCFEIAVAAMYPDVVYRRAQHYAMHLYIFSIDLRFANTRWENDVHAYW